MRVDTRCQGRRVVVVLEQSLRRRTEMGSRDFRGRKGGLGGRSRVEGPYQEEGL